MSASSLRLNSGYEIPQLGLGTWLSKPGEVGDAVRMALEVGYRHIDCAMAYGNQEEIGHVFRRVFESGKVKREEVFVTSKIWNTFHSYPKATEAVDIMLKELQLSYLDLVLIHWPHGFHEGEGYFPKDDNGKIMYAATDYVETWRALEDAVKAGKVRSIGLSNFNVRQIERIMQHGGVRPAVLQVEAHPYFQQRPLVDWCTKNGIVVTVYSPLANNAHVTRKEGQPNLLEDKTMLDLAKKHHKTPAQIALRWAVQRGTVAIPKSIKRNRLEENFHVWDFQLSDDEMKSMDRLERHLRISTLERDISHPHYPFHESP